MEKSLALLNGNIVTFDDGNKEAILIQGEKISSVGSNEQIKKEIRDNTRVVNLDRKTVMPGFIDSHTHFVWTGLEKAFYIDLTTANSLSELLELIREEVRHRASGEWVIGRGWDESSWPEGRYVNKEDLDLVAPENPVALIRVDGHLITANGKALKNVFKRGQNGSIDWAQGIIREKKAWEFYNNIEPEIETIKAAIEKATKLAHTKGVTSIHDIVKPRYIKAYNQLRNHLKFRVYMNVESKYMGQVIDLGLTTGFGNEKIRLGGVKFFADGSIGAGNAALYNKYSDRKYAGELNYQPDKLKDLFNQAQQHQLQILVHAIGERAIDMVLDAFAGIKETNQEYRHRIEHLELITNQQIDKARGLGIIASMQPNFLKWAREDGMYEERLGKERTARVDPHRKVSEAGLTLAFGSDCMPFDPLFGIHQVVNATNTCQRLEIEEAICCYTLNGAYASFEEGIKGSIEESKLADLVVLSKNPLNFSKKIEDVEIEMTILGGEIVYEKGQASAGNYTADSIN